MPVSFVGAWQRSISRGGSKTEEPQHVVWIQAGHHYADLRLPRTETASTRCFAGHVIWEEPFLTWIHEIDNGTPELVDRGEMSLEGDIMIERGSPTTPDGSDSYEAVYERLPGGTADLLVLRTVTAPSVDSLGIVVRVGPHELVVVDDRPAGGELAARYSRQTDGAWTVNLALGPQEVLPETMHFSADSARDTPLRLLGRAEVWEISERA